MDDATHSLVFEQIPSDIGICLKHYQEAGPLLKNGNKWTLKNGCPFHSSKDRNVFWVYPNGTFHCFGCGADGNIIAFTSKLYGLSYANAAKKIAADEGLYKKGEFCEKAKIYKPTEIEQDREAKPIDAKLHNLFYSYLQQVSGISKKDFDILQNERHLSLGRIKRDYFTYPADTDRIIRGFKKAYPKYTDEQLSNIAGCYMDKKKVILSKHEGLGILIRNLSGMVIGVQIRRKNAKAKYIWLSSAFALDPKKHLGGGNSVGTPIDVLPPQKKRAAYSICITEGKFKAEVLSYMGNYALSVQGVGNYKGIDKIIKNIPEKTNAIYLFYDADMVSNSAVYKQLEKLYLLLKSETVLPVKIAVWDSKYGKGIDDLYFNKGHLKEYIKYYGEELFDVCDKIYDSKVSKDKIPIEIKNVLL